MSMSSVKTDLKEIIFKTQEPIILKNYLKWSIINWDLNKWNDLLSNEILEFRCGVNEKTGESQWERTTPLRKGKFNELLNWSDPNKWLYFDYKYLHQWCLSAKDLRESIKFDDVGLNNVNVNDSTIWIGTKGAHTPCHIDTYGCNVVVQVYGKKLWLLFPPDEDLKCSRIPYEESSIYSTLNFFSPQGLEEFSGISKCKIVTLNPGDVLIVPNKWWHYVENMELSISINTWLPLPQDHNERQNECLVQMIMGSFLKDLNKQEQDNLLNPNSELIKCTSFKEGIELLDELMNISKSKRDIQVPLDHSEIHHLLEKYEFITKIVDMTNADLQLFLQTQSNRFPNKPIMNESKENVTTQKLLQALTHPEVINLIRNKLLY